jgi:hypothetical protein
MARTFLSDERPIPPEPPRVSTLLAIRRRLYGRPLAEQDRIIEGFRTQVAAQAFLDSLPKALIEPKLSEAELIRRQQEIDASWEDKTDPKLLDALEDQAKAEWAARWATRLGDKAR